MRVSMGFKFALVAAGCCALLGFAGPSVVKSENSNGEHRPFIRVPLGLPDLPDGFSSITAAQVELGRKLFFDRGLSFNNTLSCGMCHLPEDAFASTQSVRSVGMEGRTLQRNAPSLLNVVFQKSLFHDGRENNLSYQAWQPLLHPDEMANPSTGFVIGKLQRDADYVELFAAAFADGAISPANVGDAIAAFEATLLSGNSRFDRWRFGGEATALTEPEKRGFQLFTGKAGCANCHHLDEKSALFTDSMFHNTGVGYRGLTHEQGSYKVQLAPGVVVEVHSRYVESISGPVPNDIGRFAITLEEEDRWAYRTASLRDISRTSPYMHDGSIATLGEVIEYYNKGGFRDDPDISPLIVPLGLTASEKDDLEAFLRSLDGVEDRALATK